MLHATQRCQYSTYSALPYMPANRRTHTIIEFLAVLAMPMEMYGESGKIAQAQCEVYYWMWKSTRNNMVFISYS